MREGRRQGRGILRRWAEADPRRRVGLRGAGSGCDLSLRRAARCPRAARGRRAPRSPNLPGFESALGITPGGRLPPTTYDPVGELPNGLLQSRDAFAVLSCDPRRSPWRAPESRFPRARPSLAMSTPRPARRRPVGRTMTSFDIRSLDNYQRKSWRQSRIATNVQLFRVRSGYRTIRSPASSQRLHSVPRRSSLSTPRDEPGVEADGGAGSSGRSGPRARATPRGPRLPRARFAPGSSRRRSRHPLALVAAAARTARRSAAQRLLHGELRVSSLRQARSTPQCAS